MRTAGRRCTPELTAGRNQLTHLSYRSFFHRLVGRPVSAWVSASKHTPLLSASFASSYGYQPEVFRMAQRRASAAQADRP